MAARTPQHMKTPYQQYRDSLGKILLQYLHLVPVLDPACTFKAHLSRKLRRRFREVLPDHCVYVYLDTSRPPWNHVSGAVTVFAFNIELVDRLRPGLDVQLRGYRTAIEEAHAGDVVLVMQHILVIDPTPKRHRVRNYCIGADCRGRLIHVKVHYLDELDLTRLSAEELASGFGQILLAIQRETQSSENTRRAVIAAFREPHGQRRRDMLQALDCVAIIWPDMAADIWAAYEAEERKMSPAARQKFYREKFKMLMNLPKFSQLSDEYIATPATRAGLKEGIEKGMEKGVKKGIKKGIEKGMEQGQQAAHVNNLLAILDQQGVQLSKPMVAKLRKLPMSKLPPVTLAVGVKSAAEFIKRAGLSNGRR